MMVMLMNDPDYEHYFIMGKHVGSSGLIKGYLRLCRENNVPFPGIRITISPRTVPTENMDKLFFGSCTVELVTDENGKAEHTFIKDAVVDVCIQQLNLFRTIVVPSAGEEFDILKAKTL